MQTGIVATSTVTVYTVVFLFFCGLRLFQILCTLFCPRSTDEALPLVAIFVPVGGEVESLQRLRQVVLELQPEI